MYVNKQNKQSQRYRERTAGCQRRGELGGWGKKVNGLRNTNWYIQNSHGDTKYRIGNIVNIIVITMYGARWVLKTPGEEYSVNYTTV